MPDLEYFLQIAYIGPDIGLPFAAFGAGFIALLLAMLGGLLASIKLFFKNFKKGFNWLKFACIIGLCLAVVSWLMMGKASSDTPQRVIVLGLDGLEPKLLESFMDQGLLPNFQKLKNQGAYHRLQTTNPALSPVAWSSFISGGNPGRHGLFDFLKRDPKTYLPSLTMAEVEEPKPFLKIGKFKLSLGQPRMVTQRKGIAFWDLTSAEKIPTTIIRTPVTFPPDKVHGVMLSGLGVPDIQGTQGTFSFYTTARNSDGKAMGGKIFSVSAHEGSIQTEIIGPRNSSKEPSVDIKVPMTVHINASASSVTIKFQDKSFKLETGQWSDWKRLTFNVSVLVKVSGIVRFYLDSVTPDLNLYLSPINFDPYAPAFPISYPPKYAGELADKIGLFHTLGQAEDTWSLNEGRLDDETFLQLAEQILKERESMLFYELERFKNGLVVCVFDTPDRVQHMFWRFQDLEHPLYDAALADKFKDVLPKLYQSMDRILGDVMNYVDENTILIVLSDHGFNTFRTAVHMNTWLEQEGFLVFKRKGTSNQSGEFFVGVDWSKTKAYAVGLAGIYLNRTGRESQGIVTPDQVSDVSNQLIEKLLKLQDPSTGKTIVSKVYKREEIYEGPFVDEAADFIVGFEKGYRMSWQTALGATPATLMEPNAKRWSGDHCVNPDFVPGVLLMNKPLHGESPRIIDIAPTILKLFEIELPASMDGRALL